MKLFDALRKGTAELTEGDTTTKMDEIGQDIYVMIEKSPNGTRLAYPCKETLDQELQGKQQSEGWQSRKVR